MSNYTTNPLYLFYSELRKDKIARRWCFGLVIVLVLFAADAAANCFLPTKMMEAVWASF